MLKFRDNFSQYHNIQTSLSYAVSFVAFYSA